MGYDDNPWRGRVRNWAHRGGAKEAPANTLFAMAEALRNGADGLEFDVHRTKDGAVVVCHDDTLADTTDDHRAISALTLAEVQAADAAHWWVAGKVSDHDPATPAARYVHRGRAVDDPDFRVPTLAAVLDRFPGTPITMELKHPGYEDAVANELGSRGRTDVIVAAKRGQSLRRFHRLAPDVPLAPGTWQLVRYWLASRFRLPPPAVPSGVVALAMGDRLARLPFRFINRRLIELAHRQGLVVYAWTVDDEHRMQQLVDMGIDGIMTDRPSALAGVLGDH